MSKVLFVDDFNETADALAEIASALGHESATAYDGASAVKAASDEPFDVIFLDVSLPDADGREVCLEMRQGRSGEARIIALIGHSELSQEGVDLLRRLHA